MRADAPGCALRQIASRLSISPKTVGVHVSHILVKLQVSNRVEAAAVAHRLGATAGDASAPGASTPDVAHRYPGDHRHSR